MINQLMSMEDLEWRGSVFLYDIGIIWTTHTYTYTRLHVIHWDVQVWQ